MKGLLTLIFLAASIHLFSQVFVPEGDNFIQREMNLEVNSINNTCIYLGYNTDQCHAYMDFDNMGGKIHVVLFKVFSEEVIGVIASKGISSISQNDIDSYLSSFSFSEEFDAYEVESVLTDGVSNKSFTDDFFKDILNKSDIGPNDTIVMPEIGYELYISNGIMIGFSSSDGLNKWAKEWNSNMRQVYDKYEEVAKKYWGNNKAKVLNEINIQADAWALIPNPTSNEYLELHRSDDGVINFKMVLVAHYDHQITLQEFKEINQGRYEFIDDFKDSDGFKRTTYKVNKSLCTFNEKGQLVDVYTSN